VSDGALGCQELEAELGRRGFALSPRRTLLATMLRLAEQVDEAQARRVPHPVLIGHAASLTPY
jgi:hypothetical protein